MIITPGFGSIKDYFTSSFRYEIPIYQRGYAWKDDEISDFIRDYSKCFELRKAGAPRAHFFGAIVNIQSIVVGSVGKLSFELVDGQQRIATFVLLASILLQKVQVLLVESEASTVAESADSSEILQILKTDLTSRYIEFSETNIGASNVVRVLNMSRMDNQYYADLIRGTISDPQRDSHKNLYSANNRISKCIDELTEVSNYEIDFSIRIDNIDKAIKVLEDDFKLLVMNTNSRKEAYKLFQVLNDRGRSLSEGDLLRAKTIELLEGHASLQSTVEDRWDDILADEPNKTKNYLKWIYASYNGKNSGTQSLYDDFLNSFFPYHEKEELTLPEATEIKNKVEELHKDILLIRILSTGNWPFEVQQPIRQWHRDRLNLLIVHLGHTLSIPLLLSASNLDHKKFAVIVSSLERFIFRYKIICNQHVGKVGKLYLDEAANIRNGTTLFDIDNFRSKLQELITERANDEIFKNGIAGLNYQKRGNNKPIKYFLMALEYYYDWYVNGANGIPKCGDTTMIYSFVSTTIEHVYPQSPKTGEEDSQLDSVKNTIGNLTFLGPEANGAGGNKKFLDKIDIFKDSTVKMNVVIGNLDSWSQQTFEERKIELNSMATSVFIP